MDASEHILIIRKIKLKLFPNSIQVKFYFGCQIYHLYRFLHVICNEHVYFVHCRGNFCQSNEVGFNLIDIITGSTIAEVVCKIIAFTGNNNKKKEGMSDECYVKKLKL